MSSFLEQVLVFIGAAIILVPISQRLRFGSVLGYLIAGILVGPFGLKLIHDSEAVIHFAELGVVLLLFLIGLEIQPVKLWSMRKHLFGLGGAQILATSLIFFGIARAFGLPTVAAGVIGFGLSLSSTAFALQTLAERGQMNTEFGRAAFAILLMQDLVAIPALAIIPTLSGRGSSEAVTVQSIGYDIGILVALMIASRLLIRPAFRFIASTQMREIFTAATLFVVLGVAVLMQKVGLSSALGAFVAGVLLADSEYRHELEANLEPFKSLLMGLFFIAVGMGVNLPLMLERPVTVVVLAVAYLILKAGLLFATGRLFGMGRENSRKMAVTIAQGGEFAFVIFGIVLQYALAPSDEVALLTGVITLSMALSPFLGILDERFTASCPPVSKPEYDEIRGEAPGVIIAGFGRFGQIFGRILRAQNISFVAIDHDPDHIQLIRKFGNTVYYGDASRADLLESAGAKNAKYLILAIDDVDASLRTAQMATENFPNLKIFARARNRGHAFDLMGLGVTQIKRETFDSSVYFVGQLLVDMGFDPARAQTVIEKFKRHDEIMLEEQFKVRHDDDSFLSVSKQGVVQLASVLNEDETRSYVDAKSPGL